MKNLRFIALLCSVLFFSCQNQEEKTKEIELEPQFKTTQAKVDYFLQLADSLRVKANVPGVGIVILQNNQVVYKGGLGYSDLENKTSVTESTLFSIGSNTKAVTGVITAKLNERKLLDWNTPLKQYIPELRLKEKYIEENATIADALSHATGLGRHEKVWKYKNLTRKQLLASLNDLDFPSPFRKGYEYTNLMYTVVGIAQERVTNTSWEDLVRKEIFTPLEMTQSVVTNEEFLNSPNRAIGYKRDGFRKEVVVDLTAVAPAGAVYSTANDMSKWIRMLMNNGKHQEQEFLNQESFNFIMTPHSQTSVRNKNEVWYYNAGIGGYSKDWKRNLGHSGSIDGQNSKLVLLPDDGFAIMIMTNKLSNYKDLLIDYAQQIFLKDSLVRNYPQENGWEAVKHSYLLENILNTKGKESALAYYKKIDVQKLGPNLEANMNFLGYIYIGSKEYDKAIFILKLTADTFTESSNAFDSLGEAYYLNKEYKLALKNYQKSYELDSKNTNARDMISKIEQLTN